jgi:hypothetical protein
MAKIHQRKCPRYVTKTSDVVLIEILPTKILRGRLVDESKGGVGVAIEGERPALAPNQRVRIRCRAGSGKAVVRYVTEESPTSFRVGIKLDR